MQLSFDTDNPLAKSANCPRTMEMRQARPPLPLHRRVAADMVRTLILIHFIHTHID